MNRPIPHPTIPTFGGTEMVLKLNGCYAIGLGLVTKINDGKK